jgi:DNA-binding XRE family transcriptional regulator
MLCTDNVPTSQFAWRVIEQQPPVANRKALGLALGMARKRAALTLDQLAEKSGVSRRMLIEIEQGRVNPTVFKVHAIMHATNTKIGDIWPAVCEGHDPTS